MGEDSVHQGALVAGVLPEEFAGIAWTPTLPTVANPSWMGGDSIFFEGHAPDGAHLLARVMRSSAAVRVDYSAMFAAMVVAGAAGLAPAVLFHDAAGGVCVQEKLGDEWHVATLDRLLDADARQASIRARLQFRELAPDLPCIGVFDQVERLLAYMHDHALPIPPVADEVIAAVGQARGRLRDGPKAVACHGDGATSNVMLSTDGVRLVGWTQAGRMDPLEEAGSLLTELSPFIVDAETVFESIWGDRDPVALARARLYGVADDLRWALVGWCAQASHAGSGIDYQWYANWRLFKARCAITNGGQFVRWMEEAR